MSFDVLNRFSNSQSVSGSAASTDIVDTVADRNIGMGEPMAVVINTETAADSTTGDETYSFEIRTGSTSSPTTVIASRAILAAALVAGASHIIPVPADTQVDRYLRVHFAFGGTTPTWTGSVFLAPLSHAQQLVAGGYAAGVTEV